MKRSEVKWSEVVHPVPSTGQTTCRNCGIELVDIARADSFTKRPSRVTCKSPTQVLRERSSGPLRYIDPDKLPE